MIGERPNTFYYMPDVMKCENWDDAKKYITDLDGMEE